MAVDQASPLVAYLNAGDTEQYDALREVLTPGVITHAARGSTLTGLEALEASWRSAHQGLSQLRHQIVELVVGSNLIAARVSVTGVHTGSFLGVAPTGATVQVDQAVFARIEDGRIDELWEIVDTGSGLRQLGVLGYQALGLDEV